MTGLNSGSAYLFDADPGSPTFGEQLIKLTASDAGAGDYFGKYVKVLAFIPVSVSTCRAK